MKKITFLLLIFISYCTYAQNLDSIAFFAARWDTTRVTSKSFVCSSQMELFSSRQSISIARFPRSEFNLVLTHQDKLTRLSDVAKEKGGIIGINAGYWNVKKVVASTFLRINKKNITQTTEQKELKRVNGIVTIKKHSISVIGCLPEEYSKYAKKYKNILASGPVLIENGKTHTEYMEKWDGFFSRHPRSIIGTTPDGDILMIVVDGRFKGQADGMSIAELCKLCEMLGMDQAMNLDGGGSSTLWNNVSGIVNHPYDNKKFDHNGERKVSSCIIALPSNRKQIF